MIYLGDDYIVKYCDTLSYLIERSIREQYSFNHIERSIAYSMMVNELEKCDVSIIAFSSSENIYHQIFPLKDNDGFIQDIYSRYSWVGYIYIHLFLDLDITFESLFFIIPIDEMLSLYHLYHEMDYSQTLNYVKDKIEYTILDVIMKKKKISSSRLSSLTNIPISTIKALRYSDRDINKLEASKLLSIAKCLNVKMKSLLPSIHLDKQEF